MRLPAPTEIESFYRSGLAGLRFLDAQEGRGRRFGETALSAWTALGGEFEPRDRVDLLLRDAAANYPLAFAPRLVFTMSWLTDDEPFGPDWPQASATLAGTLLRETSSATDADPIALLATAALRWSLPKPAPAPELADRVASVGPATRILVAGVSAIVLLAQHAKARRDLDLADQALFLATSPAERQLWGLALLATGTRTRPRVLNASEATTARVREAGVKHFDTALVSDDATAEARDTAVRVMKEFRG